MNGPNQRDAEMFALDHATCWTLLRTQPVGRLVLGGSTPEVLPVNFVVVDETVVFRTAVEGTAAIVADEDVVFEVDMLDARTQSGWSVLVRGRLTATGPLDVEVTTWAPGTREQWMRVTPEVVTGRLLRGAIEDLEPAPGGYL